MLRGNKRAALGECALVPVHGSHGGKPHYDSHVTYKPVPEIPGKKKVYTTTVETPFSFPSLRLYGVYPSFWTYGVCPSFWTYGVYPFPLFPRKTEDPIAFFCSLTSGSGDRPRKEGSRGGGVYSFFPSFRVRRSFFCTACALQCAESL